MNHYFDRGAESESRGFGKSCPCLMKSVFYNYENEVRFVCAVESGLMSEAGGVLIPVNAADFVQHIDYSPHFHDKEKSAVRRDGREPS